MRGELMNSISEGCSTVLGQLANYVEICKLLGADPGNEAAIQQHNQMSQQIGSSWEIVLQDIIWADLGQPPPPVMSPFGPNANQFGPTQHSQFAANQPQTFNPNAGPQPGFQPQPQPQPGFANSPVGPQPNQHNPQQQQQQQQSSSKGCSIM